MVGGMQPLTMIDFPGKMATVLFAQGCNLRCRFCYNRTLLPEKSRETISWNSIIEFLKDRQGFIEGVVFSGGEPCLQDGFIQALEEVRNLGFEIAVHTNGFYPEKIRSALKLRLIDFIAVDVKGAFSNYADITGKTMNRADFADLVKMIADSGVEHEFRTTIHPDYIDDETILDLADMLVDNGAKKYVIQKFQHGEALDQKLGIVPVVWLKQATLLKLRNRFEDFIVRGDETQEGLLKLKTG
jgi:anaerobic ribonucleoside-triphosphate reductase activating protein